MTIRISATRVLLGLALPLLLASCAGAPHGAKLPPSACKALAAEKNKGAPADATSSYDCHVACYGAPKDAGRCGPESQPVTSRVRVTGAGLASATRAARDEAKKSVCTACAPSPSTLRCATARP